MRVIICDDDCNDLATYCNKIKSLQKKYKTPFDLVSYSDGLKLLFDIEENENYTIDIAYLDINMPEINGIQLAWKLKALNPVCQIVFLTNIRDKWDKAFEMDAIDYLIKNNLDDKKFERTFAKCIDMVRDSNNETAIFSRAGEYCNILVSSIKYFEVNRKMVTVYYDSMGRTEKFTFYSPISRIEENFSTRGFVRVHRSYLVMKDCIQKVTGSSITLISGEMIPLGRSYKKNIMRIFREHVQQKL